MEEKLSQLLLPLLTDGITVGLIGLGESGEELRQLALTSGAARVLLCDPSAAAEEAQEMSEEFFALWGNGMGGCQLTGEGMETYLPMDNLSSADLLFVQLPPQNSAQVNTLGYIGEDFLKRCKPSMRLFCLGTPEALTPEALHDSRVTVFSTLN